MSTEHQFIEAAAKEIGAPYVWGGKGTHLFDPVRGLVVSPFLGKDWGVPPLHVFDCSGLVTWAWKQVTDSEQRGQQNAQTLHDSLAPLQANVNRPQLRYYGGGAQHIFHVAIGVCIVDGKWLVLEASGGDHTTTTVLMAQQRGARVRLGFEHRT
ncbi:MAG TPA: NlpC/P60 family protein, partial [Flavobacteriales bacterium]|nr:NlpC/P60 family protein [Flavobacteriales bacterium]